MKKKKLAFITGINGQDGSYLSELLLEKGYDVYGIVRRNSVPENQSNRLEAFDDRLNIEYGDVLDQSCLSKMLNLIKPDEIYNLAAQSHVRISFDIPQFTVQTNALGVLNILRHIRINCPKQSFIKQVHQKCLEIQLMKMVFKEKLLHLNLLVLMDVQKYLDLIFLETIENHINFISLMEFYLIMNHLEEEATLSNKVKDCNKLS